MITDRDYKVIDFLNDYKIATTSTLEHFFYPSKRVAQRRLKALVDEKYIKKSRDSINQDYYYYLKKPKQLKHSLLITEFYREFSKCYKIEHFQVQKKIDNLIPDATIGYIDSNINKVVFLEVEISNNGFNYQKYKQFNYKKYFNVMPNVFIITRQQIKQDKNINFIQIRDVKTDLKSICNHKRIFAI